MPQDTPNQTRLPTRFEIPDHELLRLIGQGSYGEVWLARNVMGTWRAVKIVRREQFDSAGPYEREFGGIKRYEPISRSGEGLVHLLHVGRNDGDGYFYYVMELADDAEHRAESFSKANPAHQLDATAAATSYVPLTLRSKLRQQQALPFPECVELGLALTRGLGHLHASGLVHRDVKPSNVIFVNGKAKLADVGLVSALGESRSFVGTEGYIPPEGPGTTAADLYSLGKVLYEMATGRDRHDYPMLPGSWIEHGNKDGLEFIEVVLRACEGQPERRYETADEMHADLALLRGGRSVRRMRTLERHARIVTQGAVIGGIILLVALGWIGLAHHREEQAKTRAAIEERLRVRAEDAEKQAKELLFQARIARGEAEVRGGRADAPFIALEAASEAATLRKNSVEARSLIASALALPGFREVRRWTGGGHFRHAVSLNNDASVVAFARSPETIEFRRTMDDESLFTASLGKRKASRLGPFSADGRRLLIILDDGSVQFWNIGSRGEDGSLPKGEPIVAASFSADGQRLAVSRQKGPLELWRVDTESPELVHKMTIAAQAVAISPDGSRLACVANNSRRIVLLDLTTFAESTVAEAPAQVFFYPLAWHPSSRWLAVGRSDWTIQLLRPDSSEPARLLHGHQGRVISLAFSDDGDWLFSSAWDGTTRTWNLTLDHEVARAPAWGLVRGSSSDGRWLGRLDEDSEAAVLCELKLPEVCRFISEAPPRPPIPANAGPLDVAFSPKSGLLAAAGDRLWLIDQKVITVVESLPERMLVKSLVWEPAGASLLAVGPQGAWRGEFDPSDSASRLPPVWTPIFQQLGGFLDIAQCADGSVTAVLTSQQGGGAIHIRDSTDKLRTPPRGDRGFHHIALSRDGRWLAATRYFLDGIFLWDLSSESPPRVLGSTLHARLTFSPDNQSLVAGDKTHVRRWRCADGSEIWSLRRDPENATACPVVCSPDGRLVGITTSLSRVALVDAETGSLLIRLDDPQPHLATTLVSSLDFTPETDRLAVGRSGYGVHLWDLNRLRQELATRGLDWSR
jgi:WD40 repeat protein